jgi:hypothetical protein
MSGRFPRISIAAVAPVVIVVVAMVAMIAWTWRYCPDPVIDFGRELYVPWRLSEGQVLYRDLHHNHGPLAPYVNAMIFELFGPSLRALKIANSAIIILLGLLIYRIIAQLGDRFAAVAAGITFAVVFACGQLSSDACFNFLTPYAHDLTHGVALSIAMIACLWKYASTRRPEWIVAAGTLLGLIALTKAEVLLAAVLAAAGTLGLILLGQRSWKPPVMLLAAALVPPIVATGLLALAMPLGEALHGVAGAWRWVGDGRAYELTYVRWLLGIDHPARNAMNMFAWAGWYGGVVFIGLIAGWIVRHRSSNVQVVIATLVLVLIGAALGWRATQLPWAMIARPLPLLLGAIIGGLVMRALHRPQREAHALVLPLAWAVFSLVLIARMILRVNVHHYGFALAMPGMMLVIAALASWIPRMSRAPHIPGAAFLAAWIVWIGMSIYTTHKWIERRTYPVASGADRFYADERGNVMGEALRELLRVTRPHETLVTMPEGSILNYLSRRASPTRFHNFLPAEMMLFGEDRMLADLSSRPPQWIALVHADTSIYDARSFGQDYGRRIAAWIRDNYVEHTQIGARPFTSEDFGILILRRVER